MSKFRDMPEWEEVKKDLAKKLGFDEATIARIGDVEGDSLDFVETIMSLEEAFPKLRKWQR
jgi:acyl carrier protein